KLSMYVEIGFAKNDEITESTIKKQLELTLENLVADGFLQADNNLCDYEVIIMDPAYVHISTDTDDKIKELKEKLAAAGIYTIGRYGGWTYCSMEDCMLEAAELSSKL
ncbi:MAG: LPS biosynthesis protein, partial [Ruminococcaceae bacterium]|nr:LPS biosynthesis protein [Oscillospiraceae bacterium]